MNNNILIISMEFPPGPGGIGNHALNLSKYLSQYFSIDVLTNADYAEDRDIIDFDMSQSYFIKRFPRFKIQLFTYLYRFYIIYKQLKRKRYQYCIFSGRFAIWISLFINFLVKSDTKLIGIIHGSEARPTKKSHKLILERALDILDLIISVSNFTDSLIGKNTKNRKRVIISNGININCFNMNDNKKYTNLKGNPRFLTVGSITKRKGQSNFIKAMPIVLEKFPQSHYHCIGLKIEQEKIINLIRKFNLEENVTLHGYLKHIDLSLIYSNVDILILLSTPLEKFGVEGYGISVLEANLLGIPAIGSLNTGIEDAIKNNQTGKLVNPNNKTEILESIIDILDNKKEFSKNAKEWAKQHDWEIIGSKYLDALKNV